MSDATKPKDRVAFKTSQIIEANPGWAAMVYDQTGKQIFGGVKYRTRIDAEKAVSKFLQDGGEAGR